MARRGAGGRGDAGAGRQPRLPSDDADSATLSHLRQHLFPLGGKDLVHLCQHHLKGHGGAVEQRQETIVVEDMHTRKRLMFERSDAFVALPGGAGTLEELFEMWTWQQLGFHRKPVAVYDVGGFWSPMLAMLDEMVARGFIRESFRNRLIVASEPDELLGKLRAWRPAAPKWGR